jgi:hypothetical protein
MKRTRITFDIPAELKESLEALARANFLSTSQVARTLMIHTLNGVTNGELDILLIRVSAIDPRGDFNRNHSDEPRFTERRVSKVLKRPRAIE